MGLLLPWHILKTLHTQVLLNRRTIYKYQSEIFPHLHCTIIGDWGVLRLVVGSYWTLGQYDAELEIMVGCVVCGRGILYITLQH